YYGHDVLFLAQLSKQAHFAARLGVEVGAQFRLRIGRWAELAQRIGDQAAEGGERDARGLELPRRDGDDVAAQLERIADGGAAHVAVLEREEQDAVGCRGERLGEIQQPRRARRLHVGESRRRIERE